LSLFSAGKVAGIDLVATADFMLGGKILLERVGAILRDVLGGRNQRSASVTAAAARIMRLSMAIGPL